MRTIALTVFAVMLGLLEQSHASSMLPVTTAEQFGMADGVFRGTVLSVRSEPSELSGAIYSIASVRVDEAFKGTLPPVIALTHPGGEIGGLRSDSGLWPQLKAGEHRLFFLQQRSDDTLIAQLGQISAVPLAGVSLRSSGMLAATSGWQEDLLAEVRALGVAGERTGADLRDHAVPVMMAAGGPVQAQSGTTGVTNMLTDAQGITSRFLPCDRGSPVHYVVDAQVLPEGVSLDAALTAVSNAFQTWAEVSLLSFEFDGVENFGRPVTTSVDDGRIHVQLHNAYGVIPSTNTLGIGGRSHISSLLTNANWGTGGRVGAHEFHRTTYAYVAINHTVPAVGEVSTLEEVLGHELGHALGFAHSSENPAQPILSEEYQALMYFRVHRDGRGAALNGLDERVAQQPYPILNAPPFCHDRMLDVITLPPASVMLADMNQVELRGYDWDGDNTMAMVTNMTGINGAFSLTGSDLAYAAAGYFNSERWDPADPSQTAYDRAYYRVKDGKNASPYKQVRVLSFMPDSYPRNPWTYATQTDGIPDEWMITHFGDADPNAGPSRGADDDFDRDSLSNLDEFRAGMIPTDVGSAQRMRLPADGTLQFDAKPYELYEIHASLDLGTWFLWGEPVTPATSVGRVPDVVGAEPRLTFRVLKVP